jgi:enoyl-CoA hydratase/long-chain 3-hydroxyacyl-CoA dehydrogenase
MEVGIKQGKTPIFVKDVPGFFVNRCLTPYLLEMTNLLAEGVSPDDVDKAMKSFGFPVGPCILCGKYDV